MISHCRVLQSSGTRRLGRFDVALWLLTKQQRWDNTFVVAIVVFVAVAVIVAAVAPMSNCPTRCSCSGRLPLSRRTSVAFDAALRHLALLAGV